MYLSESDQIIYLANVIFLANADKSFSTIRLSALDEIRGSVGAKKSQYDAAHKKALSGAYTPTMVTNFPAQVSNLADMLYIAIVDGELTANEKSIIQDFATLIKLTGEQSLLLTKEAIERAKSKQPGTCPACNTDVEGDASFCPKCGAPLKGADATVSTEFKIPQSGYSVEFCESTSASFPNAFKIAQSAPSFASCVRGKKTWYLASWPSEAFGSAVELAGALSGLRNRKSYLDGSEISWDQLFGFVWCAEKRKTAYRPVEYCFGKSESRMNPWGCMQARMEWTEWAGWFSYGRFEKAGLLGGKRIWIFDKARIEHELLNNLHRFRFCPFLRTKLLSAVLRALPDQVEITDKGPWRYNHSYQEGAGSIKVVEIEKSDGMEFREEYFADGVRPKGLGLLPEILAKAFVEAGVADIKSTDLVR